jgi:hypothetical protein
MIVCRTFMWNARVLLVVTVQMLATLKCSDIISPISSAIQNKSITATNFGYGGFVRSSVAAFVCADFLFVSYLKDPCHLASISKVGKRLLLLHEVIPNWGKSDGSLFSETSLLSRRGFEASIIVRSEHTQCPYRNSNRESPE